MKRKRSLSLHQQASNTIKLENRLLQLLRHNSNKDSLQEREKIMNKLIIANKGIAQDQQEVTCPITAEVVKLPTIIGIIINIV